MVDRNLQNFYGRVGRIEKVHAAGGGFEAEGTLGMSFYKAKRNRANRKGFLGPLVLVLMTVVGIKAAVHASVGPEQYQGRIATLEAGDWADRTGAYVLRADPLTVAVSEQLRKYLF
ncbi:MAG: hypothetical protein WBB85_19795 [Albidovulum sp.]|uniref:hypothetical protein n=1 Tax=Albidovulum sp. TaxID=1872424 RepID=UPI003CA8645E